jgi:hypothetical protein
LSSDIECQWMTCLSDFLVQISPLFWAFALFCPQFSHPPNTNTRPSGLVSVSGVGWPPVLREPWVLDIGWTPEFRRKSRVLGVRCPSGARPWLRLVVDGRSVAICHYENDSSRGWGYATAPEASTAIDATWLWIFSLNNLENRRQFSQSHVTWIQSFNSQILPHKH